MHPKCHLVNAILSLHPINILSALEAMLRVQCVSDSESDTDDQKLKTKMPPPLKDWIAEVKARKKQLGLINVQLAAMT